VTWLAARVIATPSTGKNASRVVPSTISSPDSRLCTVGALPLISVRGLPVSSIQHSARSRSSIAPCWRDSVGSVSWT
jgi:hypothetical protein